jgi:hypothetical protein
MPGKRRRTPPPPVERKLVLRIERRDTPHGPRWAVHNVLDGDKEIDGSFLSEAAAEQMVKRWLAAGKIAEWGEDYPVEVDSDNTLVDGEPLSDRLRRRDMAGAGSVGGRNRSRAYWADWFFPVLALCREVASEPERSEEKSVAEVRERARVRGKPCPADTTVTLFWREGKKAGEF